jgi:DNA polymerase
MRLIRLAHENDFAGWRLAARALRRAGVAPGEINWAVGGEPSSFGPSGVAESFRVPAEFIALASAVFRHPSPQRFSLLYRILWRLAEQPDLLKRLDDTDVARARLMAREADGNRPGYSSIAPVMAGPTPVSDRARKAAQRASRDAPYDDRAPLTLEEVSAGIDACRRCELWRDATQGVPGEGPARAKVMLVGEQPGDQEDLAGRPFVGPAGAVLDKALAEAGAPRAEIFVTNAVKHFKHELRGKRRLHKTPSAGEVSVCRWWLDAERRIVRPRVVVALGATAALSVFGRPTPIAANRSRVIPLEPGQGVVTYHPSFLLRVPDEAAKAKAYAEFVADLRFAWSLVAG